jgi:CPA1 family monovalent cation:H+ antiporter
MSVFHIIALLIVLAAVISYINHKWLKLPSSAGLTLTSLGVAFFLWVLSATHVIEFSAIVKLVHSIHFNEVVLHGMLAFLLFSSALFINLDSFKRWLFLIIGLSSIGILISAFITGITLYYFLHFCNIEVPFIWTLIFGALIAPTDVLSVSTILERVGVSSDLKIKLIGESLFNDSVSIMLFLVIYGFIVHTNTTMADLPYIFFKELIGGLLVGYVLGKTTLSALKAINSYSTEIFMTLALAVGSYAIGEMLHVSAAVATVVAGLVIGGHTKNEDITDKTRKHMAVFWEILERVLNDVLFVLIGLEILVITFTKEHLFIGGWAVICSLFGRLIGVVVSVY